LSKNPPPIIKNLLSSSRTFEAEVITDQMLFLLPKHQYQSIEVTNLEKYLDKK